MFIHPQAASENTPRVRTAAPCGVRDFPPPLRILAAWQHQDVVPVLDEAERAAEIGGVALGFVGYEAAAAFDPVLATHAPQGLPLAWFAIYPNGLPELVRQSITTAPVVLDWHMDLAASDYRMALGRIREWIAAGDTYQVNYTFAMRAAFEGDAVALFDTLTAAQPTNHGVLLDAGAFAVLSVSPELFFRLDGETIVCRPMKGTAARGLWSVSDTESARVLRNSEKERAENVMIVDMVRNDLGRIAETGTVRVASLFDVERLDTCWQMTSTVDARTRAPLRDIFRALFPSASVTGAPKVRTMQIIRELETEPRGVYCGAIGTVGPGRRAEFSVGIRTLTLDRARREAVYHVGSGITWDSAPQAEFQECGLKAAVLTQHRPSFGLLESLRWDNGYWLLEGHLHRLRESAAYFGFTLDESAVLNVLDRVACGLAAPAKVRITLSRDGLLSAEAEPLGNVFEWQIAIAPCPVDVSDVFLYHKTTQRAIYERALAAYPDADDVILWNERRELTEATRANIALRIGGEWFTPPVRCGLLGGVFRAWLLSEGTLHERIVTLDDLEAADEVRLLNSVRGWIDVQRLAQPLAGRA